MTLFINSLSNNQVLNSYNFARISDIVYSEVVSREQYLHLQNKNTFIVSTDDNYVFYKIDKFNVKENSVIFTNLFLIESLFEELHKIKNLKNIKLITHQSDESVTKKLYKNKPSCISEWYGINIPSETPDITPIPIGLSSGHYDKSLIKKHYSNFKKIRFENKINKLYVNFEVNTNFNERYNLLKKFESKSWADIEQNKLPLSEYIKKLTQYKFILCPWGNGIDTHRVWEVFYAESIPITKRHNTYNSSLGLPLLTVKNYDEINLDKLETFSNKYESYESLSIDYWEKQIKRKEINESKNFLVCESNKKQKDTISKYHKDLKNLRRLKTFKTLERKIKKRIT